MSNNQILKNYIIEKLLAKTKYSEIYLVYKKYSDQKFVAKIINLCRSTTKYNFETEVTLQNLCDHDGIIKIIDYWKDSKNGIIIMDYCSGGDLFDYMKKHGTMTMEKSWEIISQLIEILQFIHSREIIYCDLKLENILISSDGKIKLADFGWAHKSSEKIPLCGTPDYLSPEMLVEKEITTAVDVWALGILWTELLVGHPPFERDTVLETISAIAQEEANLEGVPEKIKKIIEKMLCKDPVERICLNEIHLS